MISPPRMAAMLLAVMVAIPAACFMSRKKGEAVGTENIRNAFTDLGNVEKSDQINTVQRPQRPFEFFTGTAMMASPKKFEAIEPLPEEREEREPDLKMIEPEPQVHEIRDICEESGGWKVTHGRSWHCSYPHHRHHYYHHHRRRHH